MLRGYGTVQSDAPPNTYHAVTAAAPLDLPPDLDPNYHPRGTAPDGYAIALVTVGVSQPSLPRPKSRMCSQTPLRAGFTSSLSHDSAGSPSW